MSKIARTLRNIPQKILIQRADKLGDMILACPLIESLRDTFPLAKIHVLTSSSGKNLLKHHPLIDKVMVVEWNNKPWLYYFFDLIKRIRREKYSVYISLYNNPSMTWLGFLARIPFRIGEGRGLINRFLYNHSVNPKWRNFTCHEIKFNYTYLAPLGLTPPLNPICRLYPTDVGKQHANELWTYFKESQQKTVFIFYGSGGSNQLVPEKAVINFIKLILEHTTLNVMIGYGVAQGAKALKALDNARIVNVVAPLGLDDLMAAIQRADYYVGPDTGPTHMAGFLGKPLLVFFMSKNNPPARWGSFAEFQVIYRHETRHPNTLSPQVMFDNLLTLIQKVDTNTTLHSKVLMHYLHKKSHRVLYFLKDKAEFRLLKSDIRDLQNQGLRLHPHIHRRGFFKNKSKIVKKARLHNITILQGPCTRILLHWCRWRIMNLPNQIKPIYVPKTIKAHGSVTYWMNRYAAYWKKS